MVLLMECDTRTWINVKLAKVLGMARVLTIKDRLRGPGRAFSFYQIVEPSIERAAGAFDRYRNKPSVCSADDEVAPSWAVLLEQILHVFCYMRHRSHAAFCSLVQSKPGLDQKETPKIIFTISDGSPHGISGWLDSTLES